MKLKALSVDSVITFFLFILSCIPFANFWVLNIGVRLTSYEICYFTLIALILVKILFVKKVYNAFPFLFFALVSLFSLVYAFSRGVVLYSNVFTQFRSFFPYWVSLFLLLGNIQIDIKSFLPLLCFGTFLSAILAFSIFYFDPSFLVTSYVGTSSWMASVAFAGRLYWLNADLLFLCFLVVWWPDIKKLISPRLYWFFLIVSFIAFFSTLNRTIMFGLIGIIAIMFFYQVSKNHRWFDAFLKSIFFFMAVITLLFFLFNFFPVIRHLAETRYIGGKKTNLSAIYQQSYQSTRLPLYQQYLLKLKKNPLFGQGLGKPYAFVDGQPDYTVDVSLLSFLLPFGLFGVIAFIIFLATLHKLLRSAKNWEVTFYLKVLFWIFLIMSLNINLVAHNFIIYLTLFILGNQKIAEKKVLKG